MPVATSDAKKHAAKVVRRLRADYPDVTCALKYETPVQLLGRGLRYDAATRTVKRDHWAEMLDSRFFDQATFPLVGSIVPGQGDPRDALTDQFTRGFYNSHMIFKVASGGPDAIRKMSSETFNKLQALTLNSFQKLSVQVPGNHFFFFGETRARATAKAVKTLDQKVRGFKIALNEIIESGRK